MKSQNLVFGALALTVGYAVYKSFRNFGEQLTYRVKNLKIKKIDLINGIQGELIIEATNPASLKVKIDTVNGEIFYVSNRIATFTSLTDTVINPRSVNDLVIPFKASLSQVGLSLIKIFLEFRAKKQKPAFRVKASAGTALGVVVIDQMVQLEW